MWWRSSSIRQSRNTLHPAPFIALCLQSVIAALLAFACRLLTRRRERNPPWEAKASAAVTAREIPPGVRID